MEKYILIKTQKGKKYLYEVKDEKGNIISKRTSTREYVACTVNGEFYFGRMDLVGKGDYSRALACAQKYAKYSTLQYMADRTKRISEAKRCIALEKTLDHSSEWMEKYINGFYKEIDERFPTEPEKIHSIVEEKIQFGEKRIEELKIVYLK